MAAGRSRHQKVSIYSQAVSTEGGEDESGESTSEGGFGSVGGEELGRTLALPRSGVVGSKISFQKFQKLIIKAITLVV